MKNKATVYIVDADYATQDALRTLFSSSGMIAKTFTSAEEFLGNDPSTENCCLIADVDLPGISGFELIEQLQTLGKHMPTILTDTVGEVEIAVRALRAGAIDYVEKPFLDLLVLKRVRDALDLETGNEKVR